ncbi:MAG TPA: DUF4230 domain-containing protein [Acidimicrobiales bacterium]|nr:DUF4230 domain-containing protein [Acidimicrobiales bacterium]
MRAAIKRVVVIAAGVIIALFVVGAVDLFDFLPNPFKSETVDRSQPALLERLSDLSEYRAASAELQVLIDVEEDVRFVPSFLAGQRVTFLAGGSVDGAVDFGSLGDDAVEIDGDTVTITLPAAEIVDVDVDPDRSYVVNRDRGVLDRIGGIFSDNPTGEQELYQLAEEKLRAAADQSALRDRAERNTRKMLTALLRSLGFEKVEVVFEEPPAT